MKPKIDLKIIPATIQDMELYFRFLTTHFFPDEPLAIALRTVYKTLDQLPLLNVLSDGLSFRAVNASDSSEDNTIGLVLNAVKDKEDTDFEDEIQKSDNPVAYEKILQVLEFMERKSDFWNKVQVDKVFDTIFVSVRPDCRGLSIGKKLMEKSLEHAKSLDYKYATVECSSIYSAKIATSLGYEVYYDLKYEDYRDENDEIVFKVPPPHKSIVLFVKKI